MRLLVAPLFFLVGCGCPELVRAVDKYNEAVNMTTRNEKESKELFNDARKLLKEAQVKCALNQNDLARLYILIARCYMELNFFEHAASYLDKASEILVNSTEKTTPSFEEDLILTSIVNGDMHYKLAKQLLKDMETGRAKEAKLDLAIQHFQASIVEYKYYINKIVNKDIVRFVDLRVIGAHLELAKTHELYTDYRVVKKHLNEAKNVVEKGIEMCEMNMQEFSQFREDLIKYKKELEKEKDLIEQELGKLK